MKPELMANSLWVVRWWIDTSDNKHKYFRGYTVVIMILGWGAVLRSSLNQKLNVKSSTEGELVGAHDGLSVVFWKNNFIAAQGYTVEHDHFIRI